MNEFIESWKRNAARLQAAHAYHPSQEHDACGVGLIAAIDGKPRREVVAAGIEALKAVWHRGAVDADGKTGDGAGIHMQIPQDFFKEHIQRTGHKAGKGRLAVGMVFLPRTDLAAQETCRSIVESEILRFGHTIYGWRQVPVNVEVIGEKANSTRPEIEQIMISNERQVDDGQFEIDLFVIRRRIEKAVLARNITEFYICSLSCRSVIYKGMFLAEQLTAFYPDLLDDRFVSNFAIYHQRYSTNTFPTWKLAQPFRVLAHNGEINTVLGNINWMKSHETRLDDPAYGGHIADLKPIIQLGSSDSAALDAGFEVLVRAGRDLPTVKSLMIPEAWSNSKSMPAAHREFHTYASAVMEPWDGPAAICAFGGRWALAGMDRNGLRPLRYSITRDGLLIAGSETGMVYVNEANIVEKGRLGPGQMIAVDLKNGKLYHDRELKDRIAAARPYGRWGKKIRGLDKLVGARAAESGSGLTPEELRRRQYAIGWSMEDLELILHPMVIEAKEPVGSMGDDTPVAVLSDKYRGLHHFFRQNFSQVTNPPIDSLRERRVMTLATRLGNLGNVLDEDESQLDIIQLPSPVLLDGEFEAVRGHIGDSAVLIDCTFRPADGPQAMADALARINGEAEDAVRGGCTHVILSDAAMDSENAPLPMILATGAVHTHLTQSELRTFTTLNVRVAECLDVHYYAVLVGVGATTINPWLAQAAIADRHRRGLFAGMTLAEALARYKKAVDDGLLKVMSKMGISVISSYRGGYNFEAIGLSRSLVGEFFPGLPSRISGIGLHGIQRKVAMRHEAAFGGEAVTLPIGGFYRHREGGEPHSWEGDAIHMLQRAVDSDSYGAYKRYVKALKAAPPIHLRDLLDFHPKLEPAPVEEVESITEIRKRFLTPAMSLGALSPEAHGTLNIAMNRIGAKSDSGEGGEDPARYKLNAGGDNPNSAIKQVASGRFGV